LIHALASAAAHERQRLVDLVSGERIEEPEFVEVKKIVHRNRSLHYTDQLAYKYTAMAKEALALFPHSPTKQTLSEIADYIVTRRV
jgi:geranylgeranyl pyrophosphate synthase